MAAIQKYSDTQKISVEHFSDSVIDEFIKSRHGSDNTSKAYRNAVRQLMKFFATKSISEPTTADVDAFINQLRAAKKSEKTIRLYNAVAKMFFAFLGKRGLYRDVAADAAPLKIRKSSTHAKKALSNEQAKALLGAVKGDSLIARRNRAIVTLSLATGVRTCEISRANRGDFQEANGFWTLDVIGKGHQKADATVKVDNRVAELILSYLDLRGEVSADEPLFASASRNVNWQKNSYGVRLSEQSIGKMIKRYMKAVGINDRKITAHSTRHFAITQALRKGIDIREVSQMARHSSLTITLIYAHDISIENRRAELAVADSLFGAA